MTGAQFENLLVWLFRALGYVVKPTQATRDYGADLLVQTSSGAMVVQAKRQATSVGIPAIQQVHAARAYYSAPEAMVVTTAASTAAALTLARSVNVRLWDGPRLRGALRSCGW